MTEIRKSIRPRMEIDDGITLTFIGVNPTVGKGLSPLPCERRDDVGNVSEMNNAANVQRPDQRTK